MLETVIDRDQVFSVGVITRHIKHVIEANIPQVCVEGELTNFVKHGSGHMYFSLKDSDAALRCVFFKPHNLYLNFAPRDGDTVICVGRLSVYEKGGTYQLTVSRMLLSGAGEMQAQLERLKRQLQEEGLFDPSRRKPIPAHPGRVGILTSPTGAALQDMLNILRRRWPCEIVIHPASVQGVNAVPELLRGLDYFDRADGVDVLIVGRGGGSQEDLWAFNDESLARRVAAMKIPVIAAVGHEIDFTLIDFVADLRAPTPSAAAELAVPDRAGVSERLQERSHRLTQLLRRELSERSVRISRLELALQRNHPSHRLREMQQRLDEATLRIRHCLDEVSRTGERLQGMGQRLQSAFRTATANRVQRDGRRLDHAAHRLLDVLSRTLSGHREYLLGLQSRLETHSPREAMLRGFAVLRRERALIRSIRQLQPNDRIEILLKDGTAQCLITETDDSPPWSS